MSAPRSSRLSARVDLYLRFRGEPEDVPFLALCGFVPGSVSWTRNRPNEADALDVEIAGDVLPFDPRAIADRGALLTCWLYEHQTPSACKPGDYGFFSGVVDDIKRDVTGNKWTFQCRDLTALALDHILTEKQLGSLRVQSFPRIEQLVQAVLATMPGTIWRVQSYAAETPVTVAAPVVKASRRARAPTTTAPPTVTFLSAHKGRLGANSAQGKVSAWAAVCEACALAGLVPEVTVGADGVPVVGLYDASALQTSTVLRPFERGNRKWRLLVDGPDITTHSQHLSLSEHEGKPAFVRVSSADPRTGDCLTATWPPDADPNGTGSLQNVDGVRSQAALQRLAKAAFEAFAHNAFELSVEASRPWSNGGSPDSPDLLSIGYGAAFEIGSAGFDSIKGSPDAVLGRRLIDSSPEVRARILRATERIGSLNLLFQVFEVKHSWSGGASPSYSCALSLRQFLGSTALPIVGVDARVPTQRRSEVA